MYQKVPVNSYARIYRYIRLYHSTLCVITVRKPPGDTDETTGEVTISPGGCSGEGVELKFSFSVFFRGSLKSN